MITRLFGTTCRVPLYALLLLLTFGLTLGLAGCGGEQPSSDDQSQSTSDQDEQQQTQDEAQDEETTTDDTTDQATDETQEDESSEEDDTGTADSDEADETEDGEVDLVARGQTVAQSTGCLGCHSTDGSRMVGPTWQGAYGHEVELQNGETVAVDEAYIRESIRDPNAKIVQGYPQSMPAYGESQVSEDDLQALIAYIKSLSEASEEGSSGDD